MMTNNRDILTVIGARPQFVKAATISRVLAEHDGLEERIVHTGQHFDANMSDIFFRDLGICAPEHNLHVSGGGHGQMTGRMLESLEKLMLKRIPDAVLVYGDTNSTLAAALAASKLHVPIFHVEAGLRSHNRRMAEELNRFITDHLSAVLFCPTTYSVKNLAAEGITKNVHHVGDVMFDATLFAKHRATKISNILSELQLRSGDYAVATLHRAENTDCEKRLGNVVAAIEKEAKSCPVILPLHPRTRGALARFGIIPKNVTLVEPVGYFDMQHLLAGANLVITDSGGVQKEAYFHSVPCLTLREETEWIETIEAGWNRLWTQPDYKNRRPIEEYGSGNAAEKCVEIMHRYLI